MKDVDALRLPIRLVRGGERSNCHVPTVALEHGGDCISY
jgi:hypothetical protein